LLHNEKLDILEELVDELQGTQLLVAYEFQHDLERLLERFPHTPFIGGGVSAKRGREIEDEWNEGQLPLLFGHPASVGHGLNLQESSACHICWFTIPWDFELYDQFNRRLRRQGNKAKHIQAYHLIARDSVDESVMAALKDKGRTQKALLDALKTKRRLTD
jgi:SNF2 family DNA or RNA helicase